VSGDDAQPTFTRAPGGAAPNLRPVKATRVELDREAGVAAAFTALVVNCMAQMRANEAGLLSRRNPEFLHQFRVGLRRLRSAFRLYRPALAPDQYQTLTDEMSWLSGELGATRDWDVFLAETIAPLARCEPAARGLAALQRRCVTQRRHHARTALEAAASSRYTSLKREIENLVGSPIAAHDDAAGRLLALPVTAFAALRIAKREKSVHRLAANLDTADAARRHRLRIAAKKLRYAVEFCHSLFERKAARRYAAALAEMQDALGKLNDCATARRLLEAVPAGRDAVADASARALVLDWIAMQEEHSIAALEAGCKMWRAQERFWEAHPADERHGDAEND
jgi:triphosphatase